jgi:hypothetical protein
MTPSDVGLILGLVIISLALFFQFLTIRILTERREERNE